MITSSSSYTSLIIIGLVAMIATFLTRFLPYLLLKNKQISPKFMFFQKNIAVMIIVILIFYSLGDRNFSIFPYGASEFLAIFLTLIFQMYTKNALLSIVLATTFYLKFSNGIFFAGYKYDFST